MAKEANYHTHTHTRRAVCGDDEAGLEPEANRTPAWLACFPRNKTDYTLTFIETRNSIKLNPVFYCI